jgi:hypothetical protein
MKSARNPAYCCRKWVRNWANPGAFPLVDVVE